MLNDNATILTGFLPNRGFSAFVEYGRRLIISLANILAYPVPWKPVRATTTLGPGIQGASQSPNTAYRSHRTCSSRPVPLRWLRQALTEGRGRRRCSPCVPRDSNRSYQVLNICGALVLKGRHRPFSPSDRRFKRATVLGILCQPLFQFRQAVSCQLVDRIGRIGLGHS